MKKIFTLILLSAIFCSGYSQSIVRLIGASPFQDSLWVIDTTSYNVLRRLGPTLDGGTITGINGLAKNPNTGTIYAVVKQSGVSGRVLGTYNPYTGVVDVVGNLGDNFSSITFKGDSLLGCTGNGALVPESLYLIDPLTASTTLLTAMGNGADGEVISYNPDDDMLYHWSGNGTVVFEKIMPMAPYTVTGIPITGATNGETFGAVYEGGGNFLISNINTSFNRMTTMGANSASFGSTPDNLRGLVLLECPRVITGNATVCEGGSTILSASGIEGTYQWYRNGVAIDAATNGSYETSEEGWYNVIFSDACGIDSLAAGMQVEVSPLPLVSLSGDGEICEGESTLLTGTGGGASQWYMNGSPIDGATSSTFLATAAGSYNMTKTNLNQCTDSAAVGLAVIVHALPVVNLSGDTEICEGENTLLSASGGGDSQWYFNGSPIDGAISNSYEASFPGVYNLVKTNLNNCSDSASTGLTLIVHALPVAIINGDDSVCEGETSVLTAMGGDSFQWWMGGSEIDGATSATFEASAGGDYNVLVTDANNCSAMAEVGFALAVNDLPEVTLSGDTELCDGETTTLSGITGVTYQWYMNGEIMEDATSATLETSSEGTYNLLVTDENNCSDSSDVALEVNVYAYPVVSLSGDTDLCFGETTILTGTAGDNVQWYLNGDPIDGAISNTYEADEAGLYNMQLTSENDCADFAEEGLQVEMQDAIDVDIEVDGSTITADNGNADSYQWIDCDNDDEPIDGATESVFTATEDGNYAVIIVEGNCSATSFCMDVLVDGVDALSLHEAFDIYPNPAHDTFVIRDALAGIYTLVNSVGEVVQTFSVNNISNYTLDVQSLPGGIYFVTGYIDGRLISQRVIISE